MILPLLAALSAASVQPPMVHMEAHEGTDTSSAHRMVLDRCGGHRSRYTSPEDQEGRRSLVVTNDRLRWWVDLSARNGRLLEDSASSFEAIYPVLTDSVGRDLKPRVEWGREFEIFAHSPATAVQTRDAGAYRILFTADSVPRRLVALRGADTLSNLRYDVYRENLRCDEDLFGRPEGIDFGKTAAEDLQTILSEWTLPTARKSFAEYTSQGILLRLDLLELPEDFKPAASPFVGFLCGAWPGADSARRADWTLRARKNPESIGSRQFEAALPLRVDSLRRRPLSDPGQLDFFWGHYYATRDLADLAFVASALSTSSSPFPDNLASARIDKIRRAAEWSLESHLGLLPFFREDLAKLAKTSPDRSVRKALAELLD